MSRTKTCFALGLLLCGVVACMALAGWVSHSQERPFDRIEARLYLGEAVSKPPPGTSAVVNLCSLKDPYQVEAQLWRPVLEEGREPTLEWLRDVVDFIDEQRQGGRTVYVHSMAGVNRSAAAMTAYLMRDHGWSREQAMAFVSSKRPQVQLNPELLRLLDEWERSPARPRHLRK
jgi:protein-tyrosine phosphatase